MSRLYCLIVLSVLPLWLLPAQAPELRVPDWRLVSEVDPAPALAARAAILLDVGSATVLYALQPDLVVPPASLTKLVAIDAALAALPEAGLTLETRFVPPPVSWAENQPPGSSLMFLGPEQELSVRQLLLGLSVSSGNDAGVALAHLLDGGVPAFAERMNRRMADLGLIDAWFVEPSGLSPLNSITARSFARFLLAHLRRYPDAIDELYAVRTFTYPSEENRVGPRARLPITQSNRNTLLWEFDGADGFKTGFIDESGYHIAATAVRDGRRLIAIVLGIDADSHALGGALRARDAAALLEYGFGSFAELRFGYPQPGPVRVYGGSQREAVPEGPRDLVISVPVGSESRVRGLIEQRAEVVAPFGRVKVGSVALELDGVRLASEPLVLPAQERGGFFARLGDGLRLLVRRIVARVRGEDPPATADDLVPVAN